MVLEAECARAMGVLGSGEVGRLRRCLEGFGLPVSLHDKRIKESPGAREMGVAGLLDVMKLDKKNSGDEKRIVLLKKIGETLEMKASVVRDEIIRKVLADAVKVIPAADSVTAPKAVRMTTPGSKSISNRALVLASLGKGPCRLKNLLHSDDTQVMMGALLELQVRFNSFPPLLHVLHFRQFLPTFIRFLST